MIQTARTLLQRYSNIFALSDLDKTSFKQICRKKRTFRYSWKEKKHLHLNWYKCFFGYI